MDYLQKIIFLNKSKMCSNSDIFLRSSTPKICKRIQIIIQNQATNRILINKKQFACMLKSTQLFLTIHISKLMLRHFIQSNWEQQIINNHSKISNVKKGVTMTNTPLICNQISKMIGSKHRCNINKKSKKEKYHYHICSTKNQEDMQALWAFLWKN